jgi:hypothetical protein
MKRMQGGEVSALHTLRNAVFDVKRLTAFPPQINQESSAAGT